MKLSKRKFTKILSFSAFILLFPVKTLLAATKKIINPDLSKEQKKIMFNERTERPFTSELLKEKRKGMGHQHPIGFQARSATYFPPESNLLRS